MSIQQSTQQQDNSFTKGMVIGALLGGAVGALTALLFAPKPGTILRREIADKSADIYHDVYSKASDFVRDKSQDVATFVNEGKARAEELVNSTKEQAGHLLYEAENLIREARDRVTSVQHDIKDNIDRLQDATRAGKEAFASEIKKQDRPEEPASPAAKASAGAKPSASSNDNGTSTQA
jgi:gas vesicle protein